jgi:F420-dependent oxidoreductase-like protein
MKLGVMIEVQEGIGWPEWQRIVKATEDLGFESLWRSDHFFSFGEDKDKDCIETFISLGYVAASTSRIRFGPLVASMTFRPPAMAARMAAAIDQISGGRFILGLGAGWNEQEHEAFNIELPPPGKRLDMLEEGTALIESMLEGPGSIWFDGKHYALNGAHMHPKPAQDKLPILIGGAGEKRTLAVAARYAQEWNMGVQTPEVYEQKVQALTRHCESICRDPASIERSLMAAYVTGKNDAEVQKRLDVVMENLPPRVKEMIDAGGKLPWLVGTPPQLVEQIQAWESRGVSRIMLQHLREPDYETLEMVAKEVLPKV